MLLDIPSSTALLTLLSILAGLMILASWYTLLLLWEMVDDTIDRLYGNYCDWRARK